MPAAQGKYWMLTIPVHAYTPFLPEEVEYTKGQVEKGTENGFLHWQLIVSFKKKVVLSRVRAVYGPYHAELTRSAAADEYVFKEDTRVDGTQFELGVKVLKRNCPKDWDQIYASAKCGDFENIPKDVLIRSYSSLKKIHVDNICPVAQEKEVYVFWGRTGSGKSKRAWEEASLSAYPKSPTSIWWCGYQGHENVVIDEFRGQINISHVLRWLDRYPTLVEVKGSTVVLQAKKIWITSNISPDDWYPDLDVETKSALRRRFTNIIHFN